MINERVKELRKELNLTMEKFGERLGVKKNSISQIESGNRNLTEQMFLAICREFGVNEEWLRDGEGEMFIEDSDSIINKILCEIPLDTLSQTILKIYIEMDPKRREAFNNFIRELSNEVLFENKQKAIKGINDAILNSNTTDAVKRDLHGKAAMVFNDAFPFVGPDDIEIANEPYAELTEKEQFLKLAEEQFDKEKERELRASFAKESDAG